MSARASELADARARDGKLALEAFDLGQQRRLWWKLVAHACFGSRQSHVLDTRLWLANLNLARENTPFALPAGSLNL